MDLLNCLFGIGLEPRDLSTLQVTSRAVLLFFAALAMMRIGDRRFLSRKTAFDAVVGFILASVLARAVNGSAPLLPTIAAGFVIVLLHRGLAALSSRFHCVGLLIKGRSDPVIQDGGIIPGKLKKHALSEGDVLEDLRLNGISQIEDVSIAYFERNGEISAVASKKG